MAAPKGNQFWKMRSKHGRDRLFAAPDLLWEAACEYFSWCDENPWVTQEKKSVKGSNPSTEKKTKPQRRPYSMSGVCLYLRCSEGYFRTMKAVYDPEMDEDFLAVLAEIEQTIRTQLFEGATAGAFNATIVSRVLGLTDKKDISSSDGSMTPKETNVIVRDQKTADNVNKLIDGDY